MTIKNLSEFQEDMERLHSYIRTILRNTDYQENPELENINYDVADPDQRQIFSEYQRIMSIIAGIDDTLNLLQGPAGKIMTAHKNFRGRYEDDGGEYTAGCGIEFLYETEDYLPDKGFCPVWEWAFSRVEYDHSLGDYYIVGYKNVALEGLKTRRRTGWAL